MDPSDLVGSDAREPSVKRYRPGWESGQVAVTVAAANAGAGQA
ncbi:hypothetical protein JD77_02211 [Micromonospora olivasterospora]|uniref:Uncharacterized protein n=1 Tax=Micromonospora olivasterospora TaxID=1880 RepID=A0A562I8B5_MICOL|nr:hypothetical protein JD77_02211 [Micromonospora olivasterospora]